MTYVLTGSALCLKVDWNIEFFVKAQLRYRPNLCIFFLLGYDYQGNKTLVNQNLEKNCFFTQ